MAMSKLENLKKALADEAAEQASAIRAAAEEKARAIRAEAEAKAARLKAESLAAAGRELELRRRQAAAEERLLRRQAVLAAKAELVGRVIAEAGKRLAGLPDEEYRALIARLIEESAPEGSVMAAVNHRDRTRLGAAFFKQVAADLSSRGRRVEFALAAEPAEIGGGVKLKGENFEVDCSFERLLERAAETLEPEVAKALFG